MSGDMAKYRENAWFAYQGRLGNLTGREEAMIERAFFAGWERAVVRCSDQLGALLEHVQTEAPLVRADREAR